MTIQELYLKALDRGVLGTGTTEEQFRNTINTDDGLKTFYNDAISKGMRFHEYDVFKSRIGWDKEFNKGVVEDKKSTTSPLVYKTAGEKTEYDPLLTNRETKTTTQTNPIGANASTQPKEEAPAKSGFEIATEWRNKTTQLPPIAQQMQNEVIKRDEELNAMSLDQLKAIEQQIIAQAEKVKQEQIAKQKEWDKQNPAMSAMVTQSNGGKSAVATLEETPAEMFVTNKAYYDKISKLLGAKWNSEGFTAERAEADAVKSYVDELSGKEGLSSDAEANLKSARYLNAKTDEILNAGSKYDSSNGFKNWFEGLKDNIDRDLIGAVGWVRSKRIDDIVQKLNNGNELSEDEAALIASQMTYSMAQYARHFDLSVGYKIGQISSQSLPYIIDMFVTRGLNAAGAKLLLKGLKLAKFSKVDDVARILVGGKGIKIGDEVLGVAKSGGREFAKDMLLYTPVQTAVMPSSWDMMQESATQMRFDKNADVVVNDGKVGIEWTPQSNEIGLWDRAKIFGDQYWQNFTERKGGEFIDAGLTKVIPFEKVWKGAGARQLANSYIQSPVGETFEEYLAAVINYGRSYIHPDQGEELRQDAEYMFSKEGLGVTFGSVLPMSLVGGIVNTAEITYASNQYSKTRKAMVDKLVQSGYNEEQAEGIISNIERAEDVNQMNQYANELKTLFVTSGLEQQRDKDGRKTQSGIDVEDYLDAAVKYEMAVRDLDGKLKELTPEQQAQAKQEMQEFADKVKADRRQAIVQSEAQRLTDERKNDTTGTIIKVTMNDGSLEEGSEAYVVGGVINTYDDEKGNTLIDRDNSDDMVWVRTIKPDGTSETKNVSTQELDLTDKPITAEEFNATAAEYYNAALQEIESATSQSAEGEGATAKGKVYSNGQQTITASLPDADGVVTLSSPIEIDGEVTTQAPQSIVDAYMADHGFATQPTQSAGSPYPVDENNNPMWSSMDAKQSLDALMHTLEQDKETAKEFANIQLERAKAELGEALKRKPQATSDIAAFKAEKAAIKAEQERLQAEVDRWSAVANGIDAYNAPVQTASDNGVVTEGTARQSTINPQQPANNSQNTLQSENNSVPLQGEQRSAAQQVIDKIDSGHFPVVVFNKDNYEEVMRNAGTSEGLIRKIGRTLSILKENQTMEGFFAEGKVFLMEGMGENLTRSKYVHERQHGFNKGKGNRIKDIESSSTIEHLAYMVEKMSGGDFYSEDPIDVLADEFICRAMEIAYSVDTDAELESALRNIGANEQQIQIIKDINNEQRNDINLSRARRSSLLNQNGSANSEQNVRNQESVSNGVLEGERNRPIGVGERGDRSGRPSESSEVTQDTSLEERGIQVNDETGDARFSVNYRLDANQMDILAEQIAERVGVSKAKAKKWLKAETSLAALCMQEDNVAALYYFADGRYGAIKNNSDYPQGTVDFNNICRKRLDFTNIYLSLQREFPNKVFTAKDLETIRQIMIEDGLEVACGLCYVEDRRQLLGEIANEFRSFLKDRTIPEDLSATKKEVMQKVLDMVGDDTYIPTIAQLLEAGAYELRNSHPSIFEAFVVFNNSRGMQSGRLFEGYAEYKREILDWSDKKVQQVNDAGGLRIFSFSDFEAHHLIDIVQIISDAASKGVMIQGYTKVPEFARAIRNTKVKLNRSLIPLGDTGIQEVDGKKVLAYDTTEGIDVNNENFLDESNNLNVGNVLVGINDEQIRMAMDDTNVDYIIPFHTGLKKDILLQKKIGAWVNYKNSQTEKDATTGSSKTADGKKVVGVNIYTDVLQAAEKEGTPIKNRKEFVEYFLKVCKERGLVPRFEQFLARGKNGEYRYTKGYEKLLVDFKMFDKRGNILPQEPVVPIFDDAFNQQIIENYVKGTKETKEYESTKEKIKENLQLNDYTDDLAESESQVRFSVVTDKKLLNELENGETIKVYRAMQLQDGKLYPPMSGKVEGEWRNPIELGVWEQSEERPDLAVEKKRKDGSVSYVFELNKGNKKTVPAAYNPYIHTSTTPLNDQFSSAQDRPELVTVEVEVPASELTSGYKAEKAKDAVGEVDWKAGVVQGQLTGTRKVILSRYDKPIRIVPDAEVAERIVEMIDGRDIVFPSNVVTPQLREELEKRGVQFKETDNQGKPRFSITAAEDKAYADAVARGDMATAQRMVIEAAKKAMPNTKIVDADGNPMIVYHDTNATELVNIETGENWNDLDWRAKDEWRNREDFDEYWEERDFYTFNNLRSRRSIEMPAYFFSAKEDEYHEYGDRTIRAFLNITNPAMDPTIENAGTYDYAGEDAMNKLIEQGHDGFIRTMNNGEWDEVNAFFPNQIKSAEPATYDDNGELIPLSKRFDKRKADVRFSVTAQEDAAYMDAVNRGDMETAQRMVNEAAKNAMPDTKVVDERGNPLVVYHGTNAEFTIFDDRYRGISSGDNGFFGRGFYFTFGNKELSKAEAGYYGGRIMEAFVDVHNPFMFLETIYKTYNEKNGDANSYGGNVDESLAIINYVRNFPELLDGIEVNKVVLDEDYNGTYENVTLEGYVKEFEDVYNNKTFNVEEIGNGLIRVTADPKEMTSDGFTWTDYGFSIDMVKPVKKADAQFVFTHYYMTDRDSNRSQYYSLPDRYVIHRIAESEEFTNLLKERGYDGVMQSAKGDEVVAFYPNQIKSADPVTYDDNGNVIPLSERFNNDKNDIRFSLSNTNQRIFVSNAERAVESIKQDKATPQQWKAMIEKQGGLKAGEDKWLGLSEWLDSKVAPAQENETMGDVARRVAKNTITKQEILDYIAEHQIQIEEVEYGEYDMQDVFEGYRREYKQYYDEAVADNAEDPQEDAWQRMIEEHGEDFSMGFYAYGDKLQWDTNSDYVEWELENSSESGLLPINDTRMQYTTKGLENKREIALVVPTIESWNERDNIHFGDAGEGRAIAWVRFGETEVQTPREVIDHVDELQFAYTNANGQDVYAPQGSKFSKDYAVYGKLANGEMGYVLYVRNNQLSAHPTLEAALDALNAHYEANPRQVTDYGKVLVIDEIQSKRHQEGREKGYITKEGKEIKKKIKELTDKQDAIYSTNRWGRTEDMLSSNEEAAEYRRLEEEIIKLQQELRTKTGIIPDAPFDKNWHELAFKRMLRYAAENGFDYVAWTTGAQQAERYDLGKQFNSIEREDNPSIEGRRFTLNGANYFSFVVNEDGVITESDLSEAKGKPLAEVVGKDMAVRMMTLEDGDTIEGADLRIGGEGMKGFYDKMLPSFVSKYVKKWGAKVQDINLPNLEESAQTMHAVNVTQEMKDSVAEGQVMFSVGNTPKPENNQNSLIDAPTPDPNETARDYVNRFREWRDSQLRVSAVKEYKNELKKQTGACRQFVKKIIDRNMAIEKFQDFVLKHGGKIDMSSNAFLDTCMAIGRAGSATDRYKTRYLQPMWDAVAELVKQGRRRNLGIVWKNIEGKNNGKPLSISDIIGVYCQAKDVIEAEQLGLPDRGREGFTNNLATRSDEEVTPEYIVQLVESRFDTTKLWKAINDATMFSLIYQRRHKFIDRTTFDAYKSRKYYVPERGWRERDMEERSRKYVDNNGNEGSIGSPFNSALMKAKGRTSLASDPFAYIESIGMSTIAAVEKNNVKQKFLKFVLDNDKIGRESGAWKIKTIYKVKADNANGYEITYTKPANEEDIIGKIGNNLETLKELAAKEKKQHAVSVIQDGQEYVILLEDEQVANALNRNYAGINFQNTMVGRITRGTTGYFSAQLTQYNPEFAATNFIKDFFSANLSNLAVQERPLAHTLRFNKNIAQAMPELALYVGANTVGRTAFLNTPRGKYMQEYFRLGAQTGFSYLEDVTALRDKYNDFVNKRKALKAVGAIPKFLSVDLLASLSELSELSVRMAQYITCREMGMSAKQAAVEAKEITVNFDRKGELSSVFSGLWSFFNATIQGTNKIARDIKRNPVRASLVYSAFAGILFTLGYLWTKMNPDDPEEEEMWSDYARQTAITVGEWKVPMMPFFRMFWGGGTTVALKEQGRMTDTQAAWDLTRIAMDEIIPTSPFQVHNLFEYNPEADQVEGSVENYLRNLVPSGATPAVDVLTNEDFMGRSISKEPFRSSDKDVYKAKKYERTKKTPEAYVKAADWLSGGNPEQLLKGKESSRIEGVDVVDINGTQLQHLVEGYTKQFSIYFDIWSLAEKAINDEGIKTADIPFLREFRKEYLNDNAYASEYWKLKGKVDRYSTELKEAGKIAPEEVVKMMYKKPAAEGETPEFTDKYMAYLEAAPLVNEAFAPNDSIHPSKEQVRQLVEMNNLWNKLR